MKKTLILLNPNVKVSNININNSNSIIVSYNIEDIEKEDIDSIIYIGVCERYNSSLENNSMILVNEAVAKINNKYNRVLSSFSLNFYLSDSAEILNKGISIVNILSNNTKDKTLQDEMYNKYSCLALDKNSYNILSRAVVLNKKASCLLKVTDSDLVSVDDLFEVVLQSLL